MRAAIFALVAMALAGCGASPTVSTQVESVPVSIQLMGAGDWWANAVIIKSEGVTSAMKAASDTSALELGKLEIGTRFTLQTAVGRVEYFKAPDSVRIVMGCDTLINYGLGALEAVYIVK